MGQYFKAVNATKREFVCPWCLGGGAKLWEWAASAKGSIFVVLLRRSTESGGGDYNAGGTVELDMSKHTTASLHETIMAGVRKEGAPFTPDEIVGRWAGDKVYLVGDYDDSKLYELASEEFNNISPQVASAWNAFIDQEELKLDVGFCSGCKEARIEQLGLRQDVEGAAV